jgi:hypothetical protein
LTLDIGFGEVGERFEPQSWQRLPISGALQGTAGLDGCKAWVKTGHLLHVRAMPAEKWGQLTDHDLDGINGRRDQLEGKIQDRFGLKRAGPQGH